jgi:hypothetical protein
MFYNLTMAPGIVGTPMQGEYFQYYYHVAEPVSSFLAPDPCLDDEELDIDSDFSAKAFDWETSVDDAPSESPIDSTQTQRLEDVTSLHENAPKKTVPVDRDSPVSLIMAVKTRSAKEGSCKRVRKPNAPKMMTLLPECFVPSEYSVLCGKGSDSYNAPGNRRFRVTVGSFLQEYIDAITRQEKSDQVLRVVTMIRQACPVGAFVKYIDGRWYEVDERTAREKVGAYFRDSLHPHYRSSAKSKVARRKSQKPCSSDCSVGSSSDSYSSSDDSDSSPR